MAKKDDHDYLKINIEIYPYLIDFEGRHIVIALPLLNKERIAFTSMVCCIVMEKSLHQNRNSVLFCKKH